MARQRPRRRQQTKPNIIAPAEPITIASIADNGVPGIAIVTWSAPVSLSEDASFPPITVDGEFAEGFEQLSPTQMQLFFPFNPGADQPWELLSDEALIADGPIAWPESGLVIAPAQPIVLSVEKADETTVLWSFDHDVNPADFLSQWIVNGTQPVAINGAVDPTTWEIDYGVVTAIGQPWMFGEQAGFVIA